MKWNNAYMLCLHPTNGVIRSSAIQWKDRYNLPINQCFSLLPGPHLSGNFTLLGQNSLNNITLADKLMIFAHGNAGSVHTYDPPALADLLANNGLTQAGLISFKACNVGSGNFLNQFHNACVLKGMEIGWYIGYRGTTATIGGHEYVTVIDAFLMPGRRLLGLKDMDHNRVRVYQGNAVVRVTESSRY